MNILPLRSQYILLVNDVCNKIEKYLIQTVIDTRQNMNIHMYQVNLAKYENRVYHMIVRIYNGLPNKLKIILNNSNKFKASLKEFLHLNSYYTLDDLLRDDDKITI
jgi:hypothetical protein